MTQPSAILALTTVANAEQARALVRGLVDERIVACGTIVPGATSIYRWQGALTEESEVVVLLKTEQSKWHALEGAVRDRHPYQTPELIAFPVEHGLAAYLDWVAVEVGDSQ
jgi:periplasmic divalent cation tolerance protein